ncbi:MAG: lipoyl(octanoyl) transferase LipB, partial [Myxococcota bacterium]
RGGDVTWHGPGQLVGYVIADLAARGAQDVSLWLRGIEASLIEALAELGVPSRRVAGMTGVFVDDSIPLLPPAGPERAAASEARRRAQRAAGERSLNKVASIGVGLKGWLTYHGFALNVTPDLAGFGDIVPCGLAGVTMTSLARELGRERELALGSAPERAFFAHARARVAAAFERALA